MRTWVLRIGLFLTTLSLGLGGLELALCGASGGHDAIKFEVLVCTACGGERRIIAEVEEGPVARKILAHLGLPTTAPKPRQGSLFSTGPPPVDEPEATVHWSDEDYDQRLPDSDQFA